MDGNCDIKIEIRNKDDGFIHTRIFYHMKSSFHYGWVLLGCADFDVRKLIENWKKVEPRFFNYLKYKKEEDRKYLEYWSKRDVYIEYMCKKYEKMELMNREGILHARDLDYSEIRKSAVNALKPLAELPLIPIQRLRSTARSNIEMEFKKRKMPLSIIGKQEEFERVMGFLELYRSVSEIEASIKSVFKKYKKGKMTEEEYNKTQSVLSTAKYNLKETIKSQEQQLNRLIKIGNKYNSEIANK